MGLALGLSSASAFSSLDPEAAADPAINGERLLGVDISDVTLTYPDVQNFLMTLSPTGQRAVVNACETVQTSIGEAARIQAQEAVVPFCELATGAATGAAG
jgi:hypothetical protein